MTETPKQAARRLSAQAIKEGFKPEALHEYQDAKGNILFHRIRLKHPNGEKWIRPMYPNGHDYEIGEPEFPNSKTLYQLPQLIARPADPVWFVEGELCADALAKLGVLTTTSGGSTSASKADFSPLANRDLIIWPDNDEAGLRHAQEVAEKLIAVGASVRLVDITNLNLPPKGDAVDWLVLQPIAAQDDLDALPLVDYVKAKHSPVELEAAAPGKSQATRLIELAQTAELFHEANGKGYATLKINGHQETWPIGSKGFKSWLRQQFYLARRRGASSSALQDALGTIEALALYEGVERCVHLRVATYEGRIYIDLCNTHWRTIEVSADGWQVVDAPVRFIRTPGMHPLSEPVSGDINLIFDYLNVAEQDRCLMLAWLIAALRPTGPYPVLILQGEQGTAKSTAAKVLRSLVDPSGVPLRTAPRDGRDLMIAAHNGWVIALDNLSALSPRLSDDLCQIATGGGFTTRELYSDTDEILIDVQRPIILNGIDDIATRQDLIDRSIIINLQPIADDKRKPETEFWRAFNEDKPALLGALLDRVSLALRELPNTRPLRLSRMADFEVWAMAGEPQDEKGAFIQTYRGNRQSAIESGLEGSPVATVLRELLDKDQQLEGTATELLSRLNEHVQDRTRQLRSWPKSARNLSSQLRRLATALRSIGIETAFPLRHGQAKTLRIFASQPSHASQAQAEQTLKRDAKDTTRDANPDELSPCSIHKWDAGTQRDAKIPALFKTNPPQWTKPTFEIIPNSPRGIPWHTLYPPNRTTIDGGPWRMRI
jgi:hypothetical protein